MERGTCDICGKDSDIEMIVLCDECEQSNQICEDCVDQDCWCRDADNQLFYPAHCQKCGCDFKEWFTYRDF